MDDIANAFATLNFNLVMGAAMRLAEDAIERPMRECVARHASAMTGECACVRRAGNWC